MANMHGFFRESAGPGWALVGDAGHFKDPTPGQGIADALRQCERLADAIEGGLGGGAAALDAALRDWWRWRDEDAWEMYWFAHDMGAAGPIPPLLLHAQRRMAAAADHPPRRCPELDGNSGLSHGRRAQRRRDFGKPARNSSSSTPRTMIRLPNRVRTAQK